MSDNSLVEDYQLKAKAIAITNTYKVLFGISYYNGSNSYYDTRMIIIRTQGTRFFPSVHLFSYLRLGDKRSYKIFNCSIGGF